MLAYPLGGFAYANSIFFFLFSLVSPVNSKSCKHSRGMFRSWSVITRLWIRLSKYSAFSHSAALGKREGVHRKVTRNTSMCPGAKKVRGKIVWCHTISSRLDSSIQDALPPLYKKQDVICHRGPHAGPEVASPLHHDLTVNWSLGDKDIEVLDSSTGLIIAG